MISKLMKDISTDITSYVMKNIVLWLVELYPVYMFTEELLTTQLFHALIFFKEMCWGQLSTQLHDTWKKLANQKTGSNTKTQTYHFFVYIDTRRRLPIAKVRKTTNCNDNTLQGTSNDWRV